MSNLVAIYPTKHCTEKAGRAIPTQNNFTAFFFLRSVRPITFKCYEQAPINKHKPFISYYRQDITGTY